MDSKIDNATNDEKRSLIYKDRPEDRYWWYWGKSYIPPIYSFLNEEEWNIMQEWYKETDENKLIGEMNVPLISIIQGFIMGSNISNIVQLGHHAGYSTLLVSFMLRKMNHKNSFFTIDIDEKVCKYTKMWIEKAGLTEYVHIELGDSSDPKFPGIAKKLFNGEPKFIIIDSSHQYEHTLNELNLWYENLLEGGFIILHDTSEFAITYDATQKGGVNRAFQKWVQEKNGIQYININSKSYKDVRNNIYQDGCGLGIIQKVIRKGDIC